MPINKHTRMMKLENYYFSIILVELNYEWITNRWQTYGWFLGLQSRTRLSDFTHSLIVSLQISANYVTKERISTLHWRKWMTCLTIKMQKHDQVPPDVMFWGHIITIEQFCQISPIFNPIKKHQTAQIVKQLTWSLPCFFKNVKVIKDKERPITVPD